MAWVWRYEDAAGGQVEAREDFPAVEVFHSQADAETWLGECWRELQAAGVAGVTLLDGDRTVYGPMSLEAGL